MHEIQGPGELASSEVTLPDFHGNALRGGPGVGAESLRPCKAFNPHAGLGETLDGGGLGDQCGVEGKGHVVLI